MINIVIADDHAMVRGGLKQIFATTSDIVVVGEATQSDDVRDLVRKTKFDLLLLDMKMPGQSGVDLIRRLHEEKPDLLILVLSMHNETQIVGRALRAGASGYLTKDSEPEVLLQAIRKIAAGGKFIDPGLVDAMVFDGVEQERPLHESLSEREFEVLRLIVSGTPLASIADSLHVSPKTISTHKMCIMQKLGIDNNAALFRYAANHGLTME